MAPCLEYVTVFWKTDHLHTRTEDTFITIQKPQALDNNRLPGLLLQTAYY